MTVLGVKINIVSFRKVQRERVEGEDKKRKGSAGREDIEISWK